jgi:hypothetical protein
MTRCKYEYDEVEQRIEHLTNQHMRCNAAMLFNN